MIVVNSQQKREFMGLIGASLEHIDATGISYFYTDDLVCVGLHDGAYKLVP